MQLHPNKICTTDGFIMLKRPREDEDADEDQLVLVHPRRRCRKESHSLLTSLTTSATRMLVQSVSALPILSLCRFLLSPLQSVSTIEALPSERRGCKRDSGRDRYGSSKRRRFNDEDTYLMRIHW